MIYPEIDSQGLYLGTRPALNTGRNGQPLIPGGCIDITEPLLTPGKVAVLNDEGAGWNYRDDNSGTWYDTQNRQEVSVDYPLAEIPAHFIRETLSPYQTYNPDTKQIEENVALYRADKIEELSTRCTAERRAILSDQQIINISIGATINYPKYLTPLNVAKLIEMYKDIFHTFETKITAAQTIVEVDFVLSEVRFPAVDYIIQRVQGA